MFSSKQTPQKRPRHEGGAEKRQTYPIFSSSSSSKQTTIAPVTPASEPVVEPKATPEFKPLAEQMRPSCLDEFVGQSSVLGDRSLLRQLISSNRIPSMILWGPPGCGKTTLAHIIANQCKQSSDARFATLSATTAGVKDVKEVLERAKNDQKMFKKKTVLFIDEIHRFNKLQQDVFLPAVESGAVVLVGATTENPSFSLNSALLSRCRVFVLEKLPTAEVALILHRALARLDVELVFKNDGPQVGSPSGQLLMEEEAVDFLAVMCDGDARTALNSLQTAVEAHRSTGGGQRITAESIKEGLKRTHFHYDRAGDQHYDIISAFIKSMRGGDANAALYYLARMLAGGEDPLFIARRLVVFASEDIGVADSHALVLAVATHDSVMKVGLPECRIMLSHCTTYCARAPKSRETYNAYAHAEEVVRKHEGPLPAVPMHLRNHASSEQRVQGRGKPFLPQQIAHLDFFK
ncbi:ATPase WRNIP1-like [Dermacentor silvarum]|uniref:ATPase WRNIP1-like n=1 Tax=Dermacentor silvarum TaxID=543639 RepID=UPI001898AB53|nr:ATPase WRNIP1-like [Dermacentor silvarum]